MGVTNDIQGRLQWLHLVGGDKRMRDVQGKMPPGKYEHIIFSGSRNMTQDTPQAEEVYNQIYSHSMWEEYLKEQDVLRYMWLLCIPASNSAIQSLSLYTGKMNVDYFP